MRPSCPSWSCSRSGTGGDPASLGGDPEVAALGRWIARARALRRNGWRVLSPETQTALRRFQARVRARTGRRPRPERARGLAATVGASPARGRAALTLGVAAWWDVAALQFALAWHGFPSGASTDRSARIRTRPSRRVPALGRVTPDGNAAGDDRRSPRSKPRSPLRLRAAADRPSRRRVRPRGDPIPRRARLPGRARSAGRRGPLGRVVFAGRGGAGWGRLVVVAHGRRCARATRTSRVTSSGASRPVGSTIGYVGATGRGDGAAPPLRGARAAAQSSTRCPPSRGRTRRPEPGAPRPGTTRLLSSRGPAGAFFDVRRPSACHRPSPPRRPEDQRQNEADDADHHQDHPDGVDVEAGDLAVTPQTRIAPPRSETDLLRVPFEPPCFSGPTPRAPTLTTASRRDVE